MTAPWNRLASAAPVPVTRTVVLCTNAPHEPERASQAVVPLGPTAACKLRVHVCCAAAEVCASRSGVTVAEIVQRPDGAVPSNTISWPTVIMRAVSVSVIGDKSPQGCLCWVVYPGLASVLSTKNVAAAAASRMTTAVVASCVGIEVLRVCLISILHAPTDLGRFVEPLGCLLAVFRPNAWRLYSSGGRSCWRTGDCGHHI